MWDKSITFGLTEHCMKFVERRHSNAKEEALLFKSVTKQEEIVP